MARQELETAHVIGVPPTNLPAESSEAGKRSMLLAALHVVTIFVLCFALGIFPIEAEDIFSNILTGQYLWQTKAIPTVDPFSFTGPFTWSLNRPLPSLVFYGVHSLGGLPAVQVFCTGLIAATYALLYLIWTRRAGMQTVVFGVIGVAICASCFWFQTRIYVFAYLYTVVALLLLTSANPRAMLWMIPLQVLWINSHPSALLGVFLTGVWWFSTIWSAKRFDRFAGFVLAGVVLSNVVSPIGFGNFIKFAEEIFASHPSWTQIYEWFSPFHPMIRDQHLALWFFGACGLMVVVLWSVLSRLSAVRGVSVTLPITAVLFLMSCGSARHIPLFYFSLIGLVVCLVDAVRREREMGSATSARRSSIRFRLVAVGLFWLVAGWAWMYGYSNGDAKRQFAFGIDKKKFPERPVELVKRAKVGGNVFTEYSMGAYFLYRMYPDYKVYIDSARLDEVYGEEWFLHYMKIGNYPELLKTDIKRFDIRAFILPLPATKADIVPIYTFLSSDPGWRLAFFDEGSMVYISTEEAAARGIRTYQKLNPFADMGEVLMSNPGLLPVLAEDFALGDSVNPQSRPFLMLKSWFQRVSREAGGGK